MTTALRTNTYWDAVKDHVNPRGSLWRTPSVEGFGYRWTNGDYVRDESMPLRKDLASRFSWTITDPATVAFVAAHADAGLIDPMAGTGWWAHVLAEYGVDTVCFDAAPGTSNYHKDEALHVPVTRMDAAAAVAQHHGGRTLLLSWPPYDTADGVNALRAYRGDRVVFIGETDGGCCGDDDLFAELAAHWALVAEHTPVQWDGLHDVVNVFDRKS